MVGREAGVSREIVIMGVLSRLGWSFTPVPLIKTLCPQTIQINNHNFTNIDSINLLTSTTDNVRDFPPKVNIYLSKRSFTHNW